MSPTRKDRDRDAARERLKNKLSEPEERRFAVRAFYVEPPADEPTPTLAPQITPDSQTRVAPETTVAFQTSVSETTVAPQVVQPLPEATVATETRVTYPAIVLDYKRGDLRIPNPIVDQLLPMLEPYEQLVFLRLFRLTWGFAAEDGERRDTCLVSYQKLAKTLKLSERTVIRAIKTLEEKGLVQHQGSQLGGERKARGNYYKVILPEGTFPPGRSTGDSQTRVASRTRDDRETTGDRGADMKGRNKEKGITPPPTPSPEPTKTNVDGGVGAKLIAELVDRYAFTPARARSVLEQIAVEDLELVPRLLERLDEQIRQRAVTNPAGLLSTWLSDFDQWRPQLVKPRPVESPANSSAETDDRTQYRYMAARLVERHRGPGYGLAELRRDLLAALDATGQVLDEGTIEWSLDPYREALGNQ